MKPLSKNYRTFTYKKSTILLKYRYSMPPSDVTRRAFMPWKVSNTAMTAQLNTFHLC